jgi:TatD DNase family protein
VWLDTHIHLDAAAYAGAQQHLLHEARQLGVNGWVIPAVSPASFETVRQLAHQTPGAAYALGIHPLWVERCDNTALAMLETALSQHQYDPKLVAVGEIGLDHFVPTLTPESQKRQLHFFKTQLQLAQTYHLPVLLHVRRAQDLIAKTLRQHRVCGGIAHAFNGSTQQAHAFLDLGLRLGFGGAATYPRALNIREHVRMLPADSLVLETDAPDMQPQWLMRQTNVPASLATIGTTLADLRGMPHIEFAQLCRDNAYQTLPKLALAIDIAP